MKKKGQGLPLNVIIIAVIVLLVLIVIWVIFTGRIGTFSTKVVEQENELETDKIANILGVCSAITDVTQDGACFKAANCEIKAAKCVPKVAI